MMDGLRPAMLLVDGGARGAKRTNSVLTTAESRLY
jgi:hypothetical protein